MGYKVDINSLQQLDKKTQKMLDEFLGEIDIEKIEQDKKEEADKENKK